MTTAISTIKCQSCGYLGRLLVAHHGYKWWMLPVAILLACTGIGLLPMAVALLFLGNRTFHACPKCKSKDLRPTTGQPSPDSDVIWTRAMEADEKLFKTNKLILLGVVMAMLVATLVFMFVMMQRL